MTRFIVFAAILIAAKATLAQQPQPPATADDLKFRRLLVPADQPEKWPRESTKFLPMLRDEFERRLSEINQRAEGRARLPARIESARFTARLEGESLVGSAELDVKLDVPSGALLDLHPCGVHVTQMRWKEGAGPPPEFGLDPSGRCVAWISRGGVLAFDWAMSPRGASASLAYVLAFPRAPTRQLTLDLPREYLPLIPGSVIRSLDVDTERQAPARRYRIELGGRDSSDLTLQPVAAGQADALVLARQSQRYDLSPSGTVVAVQFALQARNHDLRQFRVRLEPGLRLMAARMGNRRLAWSSRTLLDRGGDLVSIEVPQSLAQSDGVLALDAIAPTALGKSWRLPAMRPQDVLWQDESTDIAVAGGLKLLRIDPVKAQLASALTAGQIRVQHIEPDAVINVHVDWQPAVASIVTGTAVVVEPGRFTATYRCDPRGKTTPRLLRGELTGGWTIDGVQTEPEVALDDWNIHRDSAGRSWLSVRLKSTAPNETPRVIVAARGIPTGASASWGLDALRPIRWEADAAENSRQIMLLRALSPWSLTLSGDEELSSISIAPGSSDRALLGDPPSGVAFLVDSAAQRLRVSLRPAASRFRVDLHVQAEVGGAALAESATIRCTPDSEALDDLIIHWSVSRPNAPVWTLNGQPVEARNLRRLNDQQMRQAGLDPRGETWRVSFDPARTTPFELSATRSTPYVALHGDSKLPPAAGDLAVSLVMLPEAITQEGRVTVSAVDGLLPRIRTERIAPVAPTDTPIESTRTVRGVFRYEPLRDALSALPPALRLSVSPAEDIPSALVVRASLASRIAADGVGQHQAMFDIESAGRSQITVTLPPGATDAAVAVAGGPDPQPLPADRSTATSPDRASVTVDLPRHRRFGTVVVRFSTSASPLGWINRVHAPWPQIDLPILVRQRQIWLPDEYRVWGGDGSSIAQRAAGQSWVERLFGPFARDAAAAPVGRAWTSSQASASAALDPLQAQRAAGTWLAALGEEIRKSSQSPTEPAPTCGQVLSRIGDGVFIDEPALARRGVTSLTRIPVTTGVENRDRGIDLLARLGLCLCAHRQALLLTTIESAAENGSQFAAVELPDPSGSPNRWTVVRTLPGELTNRLTRAALGEDVSPWRSAAAWSRGPVTPAVWHAEIDPARWDLELRGWTLHAVADAELPAGPTVTFVDADAIEAAAWVLLLVTAAAAYGLARKRPRAWLATLIFSAVAALAVPSQYVAIAPWCTALVVGCLIGGAIHLVRRSARPSMRESAVVAPVVLGIALMLATYSPARAPAQQNAPEKPADAEPKPAEAQRKPDPAENEVHRVLDPVNADLRPDGKHIYLSEALFAELLRRDSDAQGANHGGLITEAEYHGVVAASATGPLAIENLVARFRIVTSRPSQRIRIDLSPPEKIAPKSIQFDGVEIPSEDLHWDARDGLIVSIRQPGSHLLEVPLATTTATADGSRVVNLAIPRVPRARLELTLPSGATPVSIIGAQAAPRFDAGAGKMTASIGGLDRMRLQWPALAAPTGARPRIRIEPLFWLQVHPGNVVMRSRFHVRVTGPPLTRVDFDADPRLVILSPPKGSRWAPLPSPADKPGRLSLELTEPIVESGTIDLEFLLQGVSGVGNLRLPKLEWTAAASANPWLAVTIDPNLEIANSAGGSRAIEPAAFLRKWTADPIATSPGPPNIAYDLVADATQWSLSTRRIQSITSVDQTTTLLFRPGQVRLTYDAFLTAKTAGSFQHVVRIPDGLKGIRIQRVSVLPVEPTAQPQAGIDQVASWSDDGQGNVTAFLARRSSGRQRLVVEGRLDIAPAGSFALPVFSLEGGDIIRRTFQIERHSGVNLRVQTTAGLAPIVDDPPAGDVLAKDHRDDVTSTTSRPPEPQSTTTPDRNNRETPSHALVRRVGAWSALASASGVVSWQANEPVMAAVLVTTIHPRTETVWDAQLDTRLTVDQGVLDAIRFELPEAWAERVSIAPPAPFHWERNGFGGRRLVIRPQSPITGDYSLQIRGEVAFDSDKRAPIPELLGAATQSRWLALPVQWKSQRVLWERRGLREANLPTSMTMPADANAQFASFEILGAGSQALWKSYTPAQSDPTVALADVWIDRRDSSSCVGAVTFEVLPAGRSGCVFDVPAGVQVLQARLGEIPVRPTSIDATTQRIDFGATYLPQTISLLFTAGGRGDAPLARVSAPWIRDWPVQRTLWTVHHADSSRAAGLTPSGSTGPCTALDQWRVRSETHSRLSQIAAQQSPTDEPLWKPAWRRRLANVKAHENVLNRQPATPPASSPEYVYVAIHPGDDSKQDLTNRIDALAVQYQATQLGETEGALFCEVPRARATEFRDAVRAAWPNAALRTLAAPPSLSATTDLLAVAGLGGGHVLHWNWDRPVPTIDLHSASRLDRHSTGRWLALLLLGVTAGAVVVARRRGWTVEALPVPSSLILALAGLFWWLFLWPSWLGLVILLAAIGSALRFPGSTTS